MLKKSILIVFVLLFAGVFYYRETLVRLYEGYISAQSSKEKAKFYQLDQDTFRDVTQQLIDDPSIPEYLKEPLLGGKRRILVFKYPSGSNEVAGFFSYIPDGNHPLIIFLRGGNGYFGLMRPNNVFSLLEGYNVVGTLYRGSIYEGVDEWGGAEVDDVENLVKFFPKLEEMAQVHLQPPYTMLGVSRGAMEMFIALSRSDYLKKRVDRAISVSGNVDLEVSQKMRPEMNYLFHQKFKESGMKNYEEWLHLRNPVQNVSHLSPALKVLLIYGLADNRVSLKEQINLQKALEERGIKTDLILLPKAPHDLGNHFKEFQRTFELFMHSSYTQMDSRIGILAQPSPQV